MTNTTGPQAEPVGQTQANDTYTISNDYLYPVYTAPPIIHTTDYTAHEVGNNPYKKIGLLRGWIYPVDVNKAAWTAATDTDATTTLTAAETARQEAVQAQIDAVNEAARATGQNAPEVQLVPVGPGESGVPSQSADEISTPKKIRYAQGKQFQFNPSFVELTINMTASNPVETEQTEGTASGFMVGSAETSVQLYFDRSIETAAASRGRTVVNGHKVDPIFANIGVQKDLWDVYRIILGGDEEYYQKKGKGLVNIDDLNGMDIESGGGTDMLTRLFDLGLSGAKAWGRRIAVYYNPNLVIIGDVTSIAFVYAEFNANYVPTKAKMDIGLMVMSTTSESGTDEFNGATDEDIEDVETDDDGDVETATVNNNTRLIPVSGQGTANATYRVSGTNITLTV